MTNGRDIAPDIEFFLTLSTISAAISVRYYKTSNRVLCATTGQNPPTLK